MRIEKGKFSGFEQELAGRVVKKDGKYFFIEAVDDSEDRYYFLTNLETGETSSEYSDILFDELVDIIEKHFILIPEDKVKIVIDID